MAVPLEEDPQRLGRRQEHAQNREPLSRLQAERRPVYNCADNRHGLQHQEPHGRTPQADIRQIPLLPG